MNVLEKFRYKQDDPSQLNIKINENLKIGSNSNNNNLKRLLSNSVKVSPEIFPKISKAIENVFQKLQIDNNFSFFVTANHFEIQATCSAMPLSDTAEIILTSKLIELLNQDELESVIAHEIAHFYYQHNLYPNPSNSKSRLELLNLMYFSRAC